MQLGILHSSPVIDPAGHLTVMVEQVPIAVVLNNGMLSGPSDHRLQDLSSESERSIRILPCRIADTVRRPG